MNATQNRQQGKTTCRKCKHAINDALVADFDNHLHHFEGPEACPKCGTGYEPEDFKPTQA